MKKKLFSILAATLAGTTLSLCACTSGDSKIVFKNYWNLNTEYTSNESINETLVYNVSFDADDSMPYGLDYDGTYTTTLCRSQNSETYTFTSTLDVRVSFTVNGKTETKEDKVETEVVFYKAGGTDNLRPVSSHKTIVSYSPVYTSPSSIEDCYQYYQYEFTTKYEDGKGACDVVRTFPAKEGEEEKTQKDSYPFGASSSKRTVLDNEQFPVAFRAMPAGTNAKVQMFNPFLGYSQNYSVSLSEETKEKTISYQYTSKGTTTEKKDVSIKYYTASISVAGTNSGLPQQAEIAAMTDGKNNLNRNIMLHYSAPVSHNFHYLGTLEYTLVSATYQ